MMTMMSLVVFCYVRDITIMIEYYSVASFNFKIIVYIL